MGHFQIKINYLTIIYLIFRIKSHIFSLSQNLWGVGQARSLGGMGAAAHPLPPKFARLEAVAHPSHLRGGGVNHEFAPPSGKSLSKSLKYVEKSF